MLSNNKYILCALDSVHKVQAKRNGCEMAAHRLWKFMTKIIFSTLCDNFDHTVILFYMSFWILRFGVSTTYLHTLQFVNDWVYYVV